MKANILYSLLIVFSFLACTKEDALSPSTDVDWYAIADDPSDELTHLRYMVYKETGVSIFYNDTLGSQIRYDRNDNPYTHYEILSLGYNMTTFGFGPKYTYERNRKNIKDMIELLSKYTIPALHSKAMPTCFLLTDTLTNVESKNTFRYNTYRDKAATIVGWTSEVENMTEEQKKRWGLEIAGTEVVNYLSIHDSLKIYNDLTTQVNPKINLGGMMSYREPHEDPKYFGLLHSMIIIQNGDFFYHYGPPAFVDQCAFVGLIYGYPEAEVREKYKDYPKIIAKYEYMKMLMERHGFLETN